MIQVISKFLILILTLTTFGVNPTVAEDTKDIKIQQLETLLETYIKENRELKERLEKIESVPQNSTSSSTATTPKQPIELNSVKLTCEQNLELCDRVELCKIATYKVNGAKSWKAGSFKKFVDEAKRRNITCEVDGETKTARSLCEENLTACDATLLCKMSTHMSKYYENGKLIDNRAWFKTPEHRKFIEEAKSRNLSCGVVDLKAKAERDRQEAEKEAKLKAEAKAERDRQEAEEETKLAAENEKILKAEERERLKAEEKRKSEENKQRNKTCKLVVKRAVEFGLISQKTADGFLPTKEGSCQGDGFYVVLESDDVLSYDWQEEIISYYRNFLDSKPQFCADLRLGRSFRPERNHSSCAGW